MLLFLSLCVLSTSAIKFQFPVNDENVEFVDRTPKILIPKDDRQSEIHSTTEINGFSKNRIRTIQQLRSILESIWFRSIIVLVEDSEEVLQQANVHLNQLVGLSYGYPNYALMKFNSADVTPILANSSLNRENFFKPLENSHYSQNTTHILESERSKGSVLFFSILKAIPMLTKNSAIFVFTDREIQDEDLMQLALKGLLENQIKLYVIWSGIYPAIKSEDKIIKETAILSGGKFLVSDIEKDFSKLYSDAYIKSSDASLPKSLVALKTNITGKDQLFLPIDASVKRIHISVTIPVRALELVSPQGAISFAFNLLNYTVVEHFSRGSFVMSQLGQYDIMLNALGHLPISISGPWRLDIEAGGPNSQGCNVTVAVQTHLNVTALATSGANKDSGKAIKVTLPNEFSSIDKINLYNKWGQLLRENVLFNKVVTNEKAKPFENLEEIDSLYNPKLDVEFNDVPKESFYIKVTGNDQAGYGFSRISYLEREKLSYFVQSLTVEIGAGSELIVRSNQETKIYFEVTNNRDEMIFVNFMCQDEKSMLQQMQPRSTWLNPKQTAVVTVELRIPNVATSAYRNLVTFSILGAERVQKSVLVFITNSIVSDNEKPRLTYRYTSDCTDILLGNCEDGTWTIEVTAEDKESGLLQLSSSPKGLYFPNNYIAGTTEPIVGLYGGSCCQSKIQLTAIDLFNNRRSYIADAYRKLSLLRF
ncbi:hypothetical protein FQA39_LY00324 [Lamprigera yunnana]|nr:hypothetical protein FQA39_LY00324 [Lamprigera yunnana]